MWPAFSSTKIVPGCICSGIHSLRTSSSATISPPVGDPLLRTQSRFAFFRSAAAWPLAPIHHRPHPPDRVAQANRKHRLTRVLQDVDNLLRRGLEIQRASVGQQVIVGGGADGFGKTLTELLL